ncbi:unnamed protein product [Rotaria socialis]|uniref:ADP-ribosylation factor n=1 Tax=Rotaria socialis TaxID=392032 RepID=A0A820XVM9_9BILA|nr:unnamed protein product [Rotaria socialis]CAF4538254.1 unnamed protein product [Rotaria socialis]
MASRILKMLSKLFSAPEYRILIMGLDASGKTTILYKLKLNETVQTIPTIGFNVEVVLFNKASLTIWDVGGRDKIRPLIRHYFQNTQALIYVIDSNDKDRLPQTTEELWRVFDADDLINIPLLIYLNKTDLPNAMKSEYIIQEMRLNSIKDRQWLLQPCCAWTGDGLYEGLSWLVRLLQSPHTSDTRYTPIESKSIISTAENNQDGDKLSEWLSHIDEDTNEEFIEKFQNNLLSSETFDHRTLLRTIWVYLTIYGRQKTVKVLFDHLKMYIKDMNETLIYFWLQIVHYACEATKNPTNDFTGLLLMNPQLLNETEVPLSYYKKDTLLSTQAKTAMVLPDIKPLPSIVPGSFAPYKNVMNKTSDSTLDLSNNELDDDEFLRSFESYTLKSWPHKSHLRMVWLYLTRDGRRTGVNKIFDGLKNFIENSAIVKKTTFHFTMTYFWIQMIDLAIAQSPKQIYFEEFLRLNSHLLHEDLFLEYYKKETMLNNPNARKEMVLPDIKPLPSLIAASNKK